MTEEDTLLLNQKKVVLWNSRNGTCVELESREKGDVQLDSDQEYSG